MPRYVALLYGPAANQVLPDDEAAAEMAEYVAFGEESEPAGVVVGGEALLPTTMATTVTVAGGRGGEVSTTDGPFAETKEVLGGFYVLDCPDLDAALAWAAKIPAAWRGKVEVRPVMEFD